MNTDELSAELSAALARLATLPGRPAAEHLEAFEDVHRLLEESLEDLAGGSSRGPGAAPSPGPTAGPDPGPRAAPGPGPRPGPRPGSGPAPGAGPRPAPGPGPGGARAPR
ncbi:hypothetical protein BBK14_22715 [Parafrankia soli]|uniref:Uncharacterized protein n=1 Tax=Parafrankia soli TaxID=2599596 RepID=A0A1S1PZ50_9ACTN|nr:hypothetical protein [Parafrankia soli]OHV25154.1 hypothetical protein BBK14_22715 [Parafrankia soli]